SASLLPASLRDLAFAFDSRNALALESEFHLHPHYRAKLPLEATLLKTEAGFDVFITEKHAEQIAAILAQWSAGLLRSPQDIQAVERVLTPDFVGSSLQPAESRLVRSGPVLEIHQNKFARQPALGRDAFLQGLRPALSGFSEIVTAEFQVTSIDAFSGGLRARGIAIYGRNGVSVGDIDNDGFDDVYLCQPAGLPNRLYRNRGDGTFEDITEASEVGIIENTACALFADIDNNGRQDLIVVRTN